MTKTNRLQNALKEKAQGSIVSAEQTEAKQRDRGSKKTASRTYKVMISAYMPKEVRASFHLIQAKNPERQLQDLMAEAFNDLFAKYNVPQTAKLD